MKAFIALLLCVLLGAGAAEAQVINGNDNGNNNTGAGNGNGNGNGNFNGSNNTTTATASGSNLTINGRHNTPTVVAPGLAAAGIESCLGSNSVGGAGPGFGVTIAGTTQDRDCNLRLYSRTLYSMGHKLAATQLLCKDPDVAAALALEGVRCLIGPAAEAEARAAALDAQVAATAPVAAGHAPCRNWVLFRGCLDQPEQAAQSAPVVRHASRSHGKASASLQAASARPN